jgi:hypothetical protein
MLSEIPVNPERYIYPAEVGSARRKGNISRKWLGMRLKAVVSGEKNGMERMERSHGSL